MTLALPKPAALLVERALTAIGTVLTPHRESVADTLTPARLAAVMRDADMGETRAYLTLAEEMEEREPHYASVLATRKLGVSGASTAIVAPSDDADDMAIAEDLETIIGRPEFEGLILDCMDAVAKGFSMIEIIWDRSERQWFPMRYEFREQRHFMFDRDTLKTPRLRTNANWDEGERLQPFKWVQHFPKLRSGIPLRTGLARTVAVTYAAKRWTIADWLSFMDVYGMPIRIGRYPSHMKDQKRELLRAVRALGVDAAAVVPKEMEIELIEAKAGAGGTTLFQQSAEYWDKQTSKAVLGQTMTSDDGSSLAQSKTHERVRFDIRDADARSVQATITRDLFKPYVILNYGERDAYPSLRINTTKPEDTKQLLDATRIFVNLGGKVQASEVRDRLGLAEPEDGAELLQPESAVKAGDAPKPGPVAPELPEPDEPEPDDSDADAAPQLNRRMLRALVMLAEKAGIDDVVDDLSVEALSDWRKLTDPNVGALIERVNACDSYEEAKALIDALGDDAGDVLNVDALVASLARATFRVRGIGDATDEVEEI